MSIQGDFMHKACRSIPAGSLVLLWIGLIVCHAGSFNADFNSGTTPAGTTLFSSAVVTGTGGVGNSGVLRLTEAVNAQIGSWIVNDFSSGEVVAGFTASFSV